MLFVNHYTKETCRQKITLIKLCIFVRHIFASCILNVLKLTYILHTGTIFKLSFQEALSPTLTLRKGKMIGRGPGNGMEGRKTEKSGAKEW